MQGRPCVAPPPEGCRALPLGICAETISAPSSPPFPGPFLALLSTRNFLSFFFDLFCSSEGTNSGLFGCNLFSLLKQRFDQLFAARTVLVITSETSQRKKRNTIHNNNNNNGSRCSCGRRLRCRALPSPGPHGQLWPCRAGQELQGLLHRHVRLYWWSPLWYVYTPTQAQAASDLWPIGPQRIPKLTN